MTLEQEQKLIERLKAGDETAYAEMVEVHAGRIYNLALRILGDEVAAEDVLQETFMNAFRAIDRFEGRSRLSTWLYRIAANQALMKLRRSKPVEVPLESTGEQDLVLNQASDWSSRPESELLDSEARHEMQRAISKLPDTLRLVFILRDIEGRSTAETAEILNISIPAVKTRLLRARLNLRNRLSLYFDERGPQELGDA